MPLRSYRFLPLIGMEVNTVCVCGAGTMGSGIAQVTAAAGFRTLLYELNGDVLQRAETKLQTDLDVLVQKQKITPGEKEAVLQRIHFTTVLNECVADLIIEAIIEKMEAKTDLFNQLASVNGTRTILATNTSSLSVTQLARGCTHPERVAGLHFFNPAPVMKLVEIVRTEETSDDVIATLMNVVKRTGKTPVVCKDAPGFIVNRVARPYYIESLRLLEEGNADVETIDRLLESKGFKKGPFKLMDLIGNDINYAVSRSVYEQLGGPERLKPSDIQKDKVERNELGKKTGKGYYTY